ncbi:MAG TPA: nucleoside monophosphate kinase [Candidatus Paceibacterota bacterium]|nr:nucleoside monophosphate kinase [Candidatus Paceibacterota bacterium]
MEPVTILFFGSQGAGKGTQVKMLIDFLKTKSDRGVISIDMGVELRALRDTGTLAGRLTGAIIDQGIRVDDFMPIYLQTRKIVEQFTGEEHIIADGLARGTEQTKAYDDMMRFFNRKLEIVNLVISDDTAVTRLLARGRNDDTEEAIRRRLTWTKTDVMPQLDFLRNNGRVIHTIDGETDVESIHQSILTALNLK